ncbi:MAG TPA: response regulator [Candidatus Dormibacteraeota bacterium]|nr:response regulator [Candidatus Dormibacteraeota bacterium]
MVKTPRILVAEDDPSSLKLVQVFLESEGYEVEAALDGNRALDLAGSGDFNLLILDIHMPLYGGVEVLQMLRKRFLHHPMRIIAVTADSRPELRDELMREGIDGYLIKPVSLELLGAEVRRLLAVSR